MIGIDNKIPKILQKSFLGIGVEKPSKMSRWRRCWHGLKF
jgi:hypothetical protein